MSALGKRVDLANEAMTAFWAERLCTTPEELRRVVEEVGPGLDDVKRCLFRNLLRRSQKSAGPTAR